MPHIPLLMREVFAYSGRGPPLMPPVSIVRDIEGAPYSHPLQRNEEEILQKALVGCICLWI